jgi:hypothetical protein
MVVDLTLGGGGVKTNIKKKKFASVENIKLQQYKYEKNKQ